MIYNLVHNLCESLVENIGGVAGIGKKTPPTPITYLTQWKIVGNSEVHTLPYPDGVVLPNGYKRCKYLESDGVAYIEVPFGFDKTDEVYAKAAMLDIIHNNKYLIAPKQWNTDTNRFGLGVNRTFTGGVTKMLFVAAYGAVVDFPRPAIEADTQVHEWSYSNYFCHIDDSSRGFTSAPWGSETVNLRLFYGHNTPTECKIFEYRHKKANAEYRLIPCLDSNDTPCMYDVINNQAYYNSAESGSFTYKLYPQPTEIWSCGEYNATDRKYHILVQPQGGSIADIALNEPLRKVNDVTDTIEFPSETEGKALVTRNLGGDKLGNFTWNASKTLSDPSLKRWNTKALKNVISESSVILTIEYTKGNTWNRYDKTYSYDLNDFFIYDEDYNTKDSYNDFIAHINNYDIIYELATPTTELVDAPQIAEAESYTCVISQGGKAVSWSSFETE